MGALEHLHIDADGAVPITAATWFLFDEILPGGQLSAVGRHLVTTMATRGIEVVAYL